MYAYYQRPSSLWLGFCSLLTNMPCSVSTSMQFTEFFTVRDVDNLEPIVDSSLTKSAPVSLVDKDGAVDSAPSNEPALETDTEPTFSELF